MDHTEAPSCFNCSPVGSSIIHGKNVRQLCFARAFHYEVRSRHEPFYGIGDSVNGISYDSEMGGILLKPSGFYQTFVIACMWVPQRMGAFKGRQKV